MCEERRSPSAERSCTCFVSHEKGGFHHDGRFTTLPAVVDHYHANLPPPLGPPTLTAEKAELAEFPKSL